MIKSIIIALLLSSSAYPLPSFKWQTYQNINGIKVKSIYEGKYSDIKNIYRYASLLFNELEKNKICENSELEIRVISAKIINNKKLFNDYKSTGEVFGRYFWRHNVLYITPEYKERPEFLAHELAHYFYDDCNIFREVEIEEKSAYEFQHLFKESYKETK